MTFTVVKGRAYPLGLSHVDTDQIIGSEWLKATTKVGLGTGAFGSLRSNGVTLFDDPRFADAPILVAGANFGCGSSREHAAWAIADIGIRAIIAPSFSDIFTGNAFKNGLLVARIEPEHLPAIMTAAWAGPLEIDLTAQTIAADNGRIWRFSVDPYQRECLLQGLDEMTLTLGEEDRIVTHEQTMAEATPWLLTDPLSPEENI